MAQNRSSKVGRGATSPVYINTFITQSLNANVSARDVQAAAGHKDGRMTAYYDHGSTNRGREATHALTAYVAEMT